MDKPTPIMGRPKKEFNEAHFRKLCWLQCTLAECAHFFDMSEDTVERRCKEVWGITFADAFKKFSAGGKMSLRRWQMNAAKKGNTALLIFLGKQYLGQRDLPEQANDDEVIPKPVYGIVNDADKTSA